MNYKTEAEYLRNYKPQNYIHPLTTVDQCIFTLQGGELQVLLVKRGEFPHRGRWALPGGFVDVKTDGSLTACAQRKLREKTGVHTPYLEQVCSVGDAKRDPRGWSVTVLFMALIAHAPTADFIAAVEDARWRPFDEACRQKLAFDHNDLLLAARERLRAKTAYTLLPMHVLAAPFTLTQLQQAFEALLGTELEKKSFRRRLLNAKVLEEVGEGPPEGGRGRPAALYKALPDADAHLFTRIFGEAAL